MPLINIDDLCEPIEVVVGGKQYTVTDISREITKQMIAVGKTTDDTGDTEALVEILSEVLGADKKDIAKLGIRKLTKTIKLVMGAINDEVEGKNVPEAAVAK